MNPAPTRSTKDINIGDVFGSREILSFVGTGKSLCVVRCVCGKVSEVQTHKFFIGQGLSCGCGGVGRGTVEIANRGKDPAYTSWRVMKDRCYNPKNPSYPRYGGRGITVCDEWRQSFDAFYLHIGARPEGMSLDRIKNDLPYQPGNVRWATAEEQQNNKNNNRNLTLNGITKTATQWARELGVSKGVIFARLRNGIPAERALTMPLEHHSKKEVTL